MEDALRKSEEKFAKAFQSNPAAITITDLESGKYWTQTIHSRK